MSPLRNRIYLRLFTAQVIALTGTGLTTVALALLAYDMAGDRAGSVLGTALALKMVAAVGVAPLVSGFAGYLPRKALLIGLDLMRAACVLCMPLVTEIWHIYLLIFLLNACSSGFTPAFQATIPDVLPGEDEYTRALSLSRLAYDLESLLSPTLAAGALLFFTYDGLFVANALAFLGSAGLIWSVTLPVTRSAQPADRGWRRTVSGIGIYLATPRLRGLLVLSMAAACGGAMVIVNTVVYVQDRLGGSASDTALAFAATGAGSMIVALLMPRLLAALPERPVMLWGGGLVGVGLIMGLAGPDMTGLMIIWFILGAGGSLIQTPAGRLLVRSAAEADRPVVFAAQFSLSHGCWLVGYLLAGWIGVAFGLGAAFAALAALTLSTTLVASRLWPTADPLEVEHTHEPVEHAHMHVHDDVHHGHEHDGTEGAEPHSHRHRHESVTHKHRFVIDEHHPVWPT